MCTTIYSESWRGYRTVEPEEAGFEHFNVNHHFNFVDPQTGVHTQNVERMWRGCVVLRSGATNDITGRRVITPLIRPPTVQMTCFILPYQNVRKLFLK